MDFAFSEEQRSLRQSTLEFARKELGRDMIRRDAEGEFDLAGFRKCGQMGLTGLCAPVEYGGLGRDTVTAVAVLESLGCGCPDNGLSFSLNAHLWTAVMPLVAFGSAKQKETYLPRLCKGEMVGGNAISEPGAGSDAHALVATAVRRGDRYVLNGGKVFVTNAPVADLLVVFASVDRAKGASGITAFLVEPGLPGMEIAAPTKKMGIRTSPMAEVFLTDCEVPEESRLGKEGAGAALFAHAMSWERACILATAVGSMQRLLDRSIEHAKGRVQFGQPISKHQLVSSRIVDMSLRLETSRHMLYSTAWRRDQGRSVYLEAAMTKLHISEAWVESALDALQIHGGYGYMVEGEVERELRDAIGSRIYSGTSEIQRSIIASLLGL